MNWVDYIIIGITVFSALISVVRGFFKEALSLISWGLAFFITREFYEALARQLTVVAGGEVMRNVVAIIVLFTVSLILFSSISFLISELIRKARLSGTDRLLGLLFGAVRGILLVAVLLFIIDTFTPLAKNESWQQSTLIPHFKIIIGWFFDYLRNASSFLISKGAIH